MDEQLKIDFEESERLEEAERKEIAKKHKIPGSLIKNLKKKDGKWFYNDEPVEKWSAKMDELFDKKDRPYWDL